MPKTKTNKNRKTQLNTYKQKRKKMNQPQETQFPPVRNVPTWQPESKIEIMGYEWEAIQNSLVHLQLAQQAAQSVMSRNILSGVIKMDFEKLVDPQTGQYGPMPEEEKVQNRKDFDDMITKFKAEVAKNAQPQAPALVDANGAALVPVDSPVPSTESAEPEAKVVQMYADAEPKPADPTGK